jgi:hypothetical protein
VITDGLALGYQYMPRRSSATMAPRRRQARPSSIADDVSGSRAPHAWLADGRSTLDLFGNGFTLLRLGSSAPQPLTMERAFAQRGVPLSSIGIADPAIVTLYERALVLVRPDGHVAWRGDEEPTDSLAVVDHVRGADAATFD